MWKTDINSLFDLDINLLSTIESKSESYLNETIETFKNQSERTKHLLAIQIGLLTSICTYIFSQNEFSYLFVLSLVSIIPLLVSFVLTLFNFFSKSVHVSGIEPKEFLNKNLLADNLDNHKKSIVVFVNLIENYQDRIDHNSRVNVIKDRLNRLSLVSLIILSICPLVSYLIFQCFHF